MGGPAMLIFGPCPQDMVMSNRVFTLAALVIFGLASGAAAADAQMTAQPRYQQPAYYQPPPYQQPYYQQPYPAPAYYPQQPYQSSCCCPTTRRGFSFNFSSCGNRNSYPQYPQYQQPYPQVQTYPQYQYQPAYQPYPAPAYQPYPQQMYYQPGYAPQFSVGVGIGARVNYRNDRNNPRRHCSRIKGRWVCR
jgi:hypothetical protein